MDWTVELEHEMERGIKHSTGRHRGRGFKSRDYRGLKNVTL